MKIYRNIMTVIGCGLLTTSTVFATENLITCDRPGIMNTGCKVTPFEIDTNENFEVDITIKYKFKCEGHNRKIGLIGDFSFKDLPQVNDWSYITVTTKEKVQLAAQDEDLFYSAFLRNCEFFIEKTNVLPSTDTLYTWNRDAFYQTRIINQGIDLYLLSGDLENYQNWDRSSTTTLLNGVNRKITAFERQCNRGDQTACQAKIHFIAVKNSLQAKLDGTPIPSVGNDDISVVKSNYLEQLREDVQTGNNMIKRFEKWELEVEETLKDILDEVPGEV